MIMGIPYITFFTNENIATFFQNVGALLYFVMPILLIFVATMFAGELFKVVRRAFTRNPEEPRYDKKNENYDVKVKDVKY